MPRPQNFVSAFVNINVCPPPFLGKMFTKLTDKNRVGPPPPLGCSQHLYNDQSIINNAPQGLS